MAFSIRHHRITFGALSASQHALPVNQGPQPHKRLDSNAWLFLHHHGLTAVLVEHPARNHESHIFLTLYDDPRFLMRSQVANHPDFVFKKRMKSVGDPSRAKLMSSVSRR
jgi:hypothetical protein